jgi:hypothetical protein
MTARVLILTLLAGALGLGGCAAAAGTVTTRVRPGVELPAGLAVSGLGAGNDSGWHRARSAATVSKAADAESIETLIADTGFGRSSARWATSSPCVSETVEYETHQSSRPSPTAG